VSSLSETQTFYGPAALAAAVRDFDRDAVANRKRIAEILRVEPEGFYLTAVGILGRDLDSSVAQYLVTLLVQGNLLFRALCDSALDLERATELARQANRFDSTVPIELARRLADASSASGACAAGMAGRLLEILDEIADGKRILPSLMRILRSDNPYLRSKAVLMIGRSGQSVAWIEKRLQEADTRVRANAIEAMWGMDTAEVRQLLKWAIRDSNNRVVGNALVGLYRLGEISPLAELVKRATVDSPAMRRTAAWAMGEIGDPRFSGVLGHMIADHNPNVRRAAFGAVRRIRAANAQVLSTAEWSIAGSCSPKDPRTGQRCVSLAVGTADGGGIPRVLPVQFMLSENGQPVWSYRVEEGMAPDPMTVMFLFPRKVDNSANPWDQGGLRCLQWRRSTDLWSAVPYFGAGDNAPPDAEDTAFPSFTANVSEAARMFREVPIRMDCTSFWTAVQRAVLPPGNRALRGKRHVIVLAPDEVAANADDAVISAVQASRASIQVVSTSANPLLREFCRRVYGHFHYVEDNSAIEEAISRTYLSLLARYEIRYQPVSPAATSLKLRVHTPTGWGETKVEL